MNTIKDNKKDEEKLNIIMHCIVSLIIAIIFGIICGCMQRNFWIGLLNTALYVLICIPVTIAMGWVRKVYKFIKENNNNV